MANSDPNKPFFLIVADLDTGLFCVEGPMTDDRPCDTPPNNALRKNGAVTATAGQLVRTAMRWRVGFCKPTSSAASQ